MGYPQPSNERTYHHHHLHHPVFNNWSAQRTHPSVCLWYLPILRLSGNNFLSSCRSKACIDSLQVAYVEFQVYPVYPRTRFVGFHLSFTTHLFPQEQHKVFSINGCISNALGQLPSLPEFKAWFHWKRHFQVLFFIVTHIYFAKVLFSLQKNKICLVFFHYFKKNS